MKSEAELKELKGYMLKDLEAREEELKTAVTTTEKIDAHVNLIIRLVHIDVINAVLSDTPINY